ncbi:hypothetical protein EW093_09510 [Thiospirochaeta perfilievii]|uniref:Uncharacterized protein n=1 Tax=Thiospirochaeta perfilievii TaxID=252967 RepID=A0A5C1QDY6_9SPIO|nr:hypothetical protein [Thiospirochaeta perfilievii]QEN04934.1 hypothetical protein EW093_09510 [Thiospirochaeta perfilievii]
MKNLLKVFCLLVFTAIFVSCEDPLGSQATNDYSTEIVDEFISEITGNRALTGLNIADMKAAIIAELESKGLDTSQNLGELIPVIASSAQVSLKTVGTEEDRIIYIKNISKSSITVIGKKASSSISVTDKTKMVSNVSIAMVEKISDSGISAEKIEETTKATISSVVSSLGSVELDNVGALTAISLITKGSSVALSKNSGITDEILQNTLSNIPSTATTASKSIENIALNPKDVLKGSFSSVTESVKEIKDSGKTIDVAVTLQKVLEVTTTSYASDDSISFDNIKDDLLKDTIAAAKEDGASEVLEELKTGLTESTVVEVSKEDITGAEEAIEDDEVTENPDATTAELEVAGFNQLKAGSLDMALVSFEKAKNSTGGLSDKGKMWWSMLTLASMSIDSNVTDVVENLGINAYPTTMEGVIAGDMIVSGEYEITNDNYHGYDYYSMLRKVDNEELFYSMFQVTDSDKRSVSEAQFVAMLYNLKNSYPNGLNSIVDSLIAATSKFDDVVAMMDTIEDDAAFTYTYDMFNDEAFEEGNSEWPSYTNDSNALVPFDITAGKAEVYALMSTIELIKSVALMGQSISLSADLDGYWDVFNPLDGNLWVIADGKITGISEDFDLTTLRNPLSDGFLQSRENATTILAEAKTHFVNFFTYVKGASDLVAGRDANSPFFLSPATAQFTESWTMVSTIQKFTSLVTGKIIDSLENKTPILLPGSIMGITSPDDLNNLVWPTEDADGVMSLNLNALFAKPIFALDSLLDMTGTGEFVIYEAGDTTYQVATAFDQDKQYYVKFNDLTFGGLASGVQDMILDFVPMELVLEDDDSIFVPLPPMTLEAVGHSLTAAGSTFTLGETSIKSTGSFFYYLADMGLGIIGSEIAASVAWEEGYEQGYTKGSSDNASDANFNNDTLSDDDDYIEGYEVGYYDGYWGGPKII